ncbi:MAG: DUF7666 domain-containing protein [Terriglobia bacterium]
MSLRAWHFVGSILRDGRPIPPDGEWLEHTGPLILCESGLHASLDPFDALQYAHGNTLCLVELDGDILKASDKVCASRRRIIARIDLTEFLKTFARQQALSVLHLWDAPPIVEEFLRTGNPAIAATAAAATAWAAAKAAGAATRAATAAGAAKAAATRAETRKVFSSQVETMFLS